MNHEQNLSVMTSELGVIIFWVGINALIGYAIGQKKNAVGPAIALCILLGPIGWLIAALMPGDFRKCPFCAENVKHEAIVCPHCQRDLPELVVPARQARNRTTRAVLCAILTAGVIFLIGLWMAVRFNEWENNKTTMITYLRSHSKPGVFLDEALTPPEQETLSSLKSLLNHKPFLPLNAEEKKWLNRAIEEEQSK